MANFCVRFDIVTSCATLILKEPQDVVTQLQFTFVGDRTTLARTCDDATVDIANGALYACATTLKTIQVEVLGDYLPSPRTLPLSSHRSLC